MDSGIERAQTARTIIGTLATLWLLYASPFQGSATDLAKNKFGEIFINTGILLVAGPLALAGFVLAARPPVRRLYGRRLIAPVTGFCALFGCPALLWFLFRYVIGGGATAASPYAGHSTGNPATAPHLWERPGDPASPTTADIA
ncbi:hypothetical protein [Streptomyces sp. NPDC093707]|uniref:hypothetical protein n=1 Tax=Streptomyces sp. NPDC093707 TaxID=3154984 RepID=UPI00344D794B